MFRLTERNIIYYVRFLFGYKYTTFLVIHYVFYNINHKKQT